jgi:hypothetical protein
MPMFAPPLALEEEVVAAGAVAVVAVALEEVVALAAVVEALAGTIMFYWEGEKKDFLQDVRTGNCGNHLVGSLFSFCLAHHSWDNF